MEKENKTFWVVFITMMLTGVVGIGWLWHSETIGKIVWAIIILLMISFIVAMDASVRVITLPK